MKIKKTIQLTEYNYLFVGEEDEGKNRAITEKVFDELESFVLKNSETVQYLKLGQNKKYKFLQAQNYVGVIQTRSGVVVEILPKIADLNSGEGGEKEVKKILIKMLKTLRKSPFKNFDMANLNSVDLPLLEIFITMFLEELSILIKKGIKSDYIDKEENLKFLKGKLKISNQIKENYIHRERFFVEYQDFISDRLENRFIKTTLEYLYKKSKTNKNQQRIREFLFVFDDIKILHNIKNDFSKIRVSRNMKDYEKILNWCGIFLFGNSFSPYSGKEVSFALLFDMNMLFESYVGNYLRVKGYDVKLQDREHHLAYLDGIGKFRLKPDIVIREEGGDVIVADTKWKILSKEKTHQGVSQSDMYQLYAYGTKYKECKKMYLIYPKDSEMIGEEYDYFKEEELKLKVLFFDLKSGEFCGGEGELLK